MKSLLDLLEQERSYINDIRYLDTQTSDFDEELQKALSKEDEDRVKLIEFAICEVSEQAYFVREKLRETRDSIRQYFAEHATEKEGS